MDNLKDIIVTFTEKEVCILFEALEFVQPKFMTSCLYNGVSTPITKPDMNNLNLKLRWILGRVNDKENAKLSPIQDEGGGGIDAYIKNQSF